MADSPFNRWLHEDQQAGPLDDFCGEPKRTEPWKTERCSVCGGGFSEASWDDRHTDPRDGLSDCHARCCPRCRTSRR